MNHALRTFLTFLLVNNVLSEQGELESVVVVYRHGDRSPVSLYPTDPYPASIWNVSLGQLMNEGKERHYELGQWFRKRYDGFLSKYYTEKEIKVFCTEYDRTLMSAESNLAGLYPPQDYQVWNSDLKWQPIPVHPASLALLNAESVCTKIQKLQDELIQTHILFRALDMVNKDLYQYLQKNSGLNIATFRDAALLRDTLFIESHNNLALPEWTYDVYPEKLDPLESYSFATYSYTEELAQLNSGPFLNNVIEHFQSIISGTSDDLPKFLMYSAHDSSVASILGGMGAFKPHCPYFASTVIFELRKKSTGHFVNVYYKSQEDISPIQVKKCEASNCSFEDFKSNLSSVAITPQQWLGKCFLEDLIPALQAKFLGEFKTDYLMT